ncbi:MAG TPA: hypothetical protein VH854_07690 [Thermoanaerobaculia bacterium]|nr:hypothetical protein [Thermoanaerobaculia bacterium]
MDILSYPVGLLIGLLPIAADLGPERAPAHLLLDSRPVCELTSRAPGCMVDLGLSPRIHLLELVRTDAAGHVTERVGRWVNRPGVHPEILARGSCDEKAASCDFDLAWAHPRRLDPDRVDLTLDGRPVWHGRDRHAKIALAKGAKPQVLVVDARFSDGTRASFTKTLFAFYPEEARAELQAVPVVPADPNASNDAVAAALKNAGLRIRTVESDEPDLVFVVEPRAFDGIPGMLSQPVQAPGRYAIEIRNPTGRSGNKGTPVQVIVPDQALSAFSTTTWGINRLVPTVGTSASRFADAVAAAGYVLGESSRPRAVVLVLRGFAERNASNFNAAQARAYLSEVGVPLCVWRVGGVEAPEWPDGPRLATRDELRAAFDSLEKDVRAQRVAWLEGPLDLSQAPRFIVPGIALAGRAAVPAPDSPSTFGAPDARAAAVGPDGGPVHALASSGKTVWAGTHAGVFRSIDGGARWERASAGLPAVPVRCLLAAGGVLLAGTDTGLFASRDEGSSWSEVNGLEGRTVAALAADLEKPPTLYAAVRGLGVLRSRDAGATFLATLLTSGDARALAVDPRDGSVWAGSGEGVRRSDDRGWTWTETAPLPGRAAALAADPRGGRVWAATSGQGLFVSDDHGGTWKATGLSNAVLGALAVSADAKTLLAASADGVFSSVDGGAKWKLARVGPVEAIAPTSGGAEWLAAGPRGVLRAAGSGRAWSPSNAGLAAEVVYAARPAPDAAGAVLAGTSCGLQRRDGTGWKPVAGTPDGVPVYAVGADTTGAAAELLVGSAGEIGRSFERGASWSWTPVASVFGFGLGAGVGAHPLAATRAAILGSADGGLSWTDSSAGVTKTFPLQIAVDPRDRAVAYAATAGGGVFRSTDGGRTWKPGGSELSRFIVRSVTVDPNASSTVYAGTDRGVYGSVTGGRSWTPLFEGLPQAPVYAIVADPESPLELFAGTGAGLFHSYDAGGHWTPFPSLGAIPAGVASLWLDSERGELVLGTLGAGVYVIRLRGE